MRSIRCAWVAFAVACSGGDTGNPKGSPVGSTETGTTDGGDSSVDIRGDCPLGMVEIAAATLELGEDDAGYAEPYLGQVVLAREMTLDAFCVDAFPFPGEGRAWTSDALDWDGVMAFQVAISAYGRRLCTVAELMHAAAGPENWRYPYDRLDFRDGKCEPGDVTPGDPIGSYPDCVSPYGVRDFMVRSTWAVLDDQAGEDIRAFYMSDSGLLIPGGGEYAVWGGSASQNTFYAPNNYGLHFYGPGDPGYINESVRTCAGLGRGSDADDAAWTAFVDDFEAGGGFASL